MEIAEYLAKSKEKRSEMIKTAEKFLRKSKASLEGSEENSSDNFGPTPQKFKEYEFRVNERVKKMFNPSLECAPLSRFKYQKSKEMLVRVYSNKLGEHEQKKYILQKNVKNKEREPKALVPRHSKHGSFNIKCLFTPILSSSPAKRSRLASRNS